MRREFDIQGHRGARGLLPENTLPAFLKAIEVGVTTLEMDVVISADHEVVVSHDPWMSSEICSGPDGTPVAADEERNLRIFRMRYEEIAKFDCGLRRPEGFPEQESLPAIKPLLKDVIEMAERVAGETRRKPLEYNIETKSRPQWDNEFHPPPRLFTGLLLGVLRNHGVVSRSIVQSFDPRTLREARRMAPNWRTSLLVGKALGRFPGLSLRRLGFVPHIYSPHYAVLSPGLVRRIHRRGMSLVPWTLNSEEDIERSIALGVDGIITDFPDRARRVMERLLTD
jgi:glycerophosphoryl diester phosphodiesterase